MLAEAIRQDDVVEQVRLGQATWPRSTRPTATPTYVLAADELDGTSPNVPEVRRHLKVLEAETPRRARTEWIAARLAALANDKARLDADPQAGPGHDPARPTPTRSTGWPCSGSASSTSPTTADPAALAGPIEAVTREALAASAEPEIPSTRIARISLLIEEVQRSLIRRGPGRPRPPASGSRPTATRSTRPPRRSSRSRWTSRAGPT